ncbi:hypothetical protein D5086_019082 [Populus alba]|uniref:Uncharacterized protein n=1 Tax=Populus alba TaxID=43335 RepID=A0ACC4BHU4_POPAL
MIQRFPLASRFPVLLDGLEQETSTGLGKVRAITSSRNEWWSLNGKGKPQNIEHGSNTYAPAMNATCTFQDMVRDVLVKLGLFITLYTTSQSLSIVSIRMQLLKSSLVGPKNIFQR